MNEIFHPRKAILYQSIAFEVFFSAAAAGSTLMVLDESTKHPIEHWHKAAGIAMFLTIYGGMALMSIVMFVSYFRERVIISGTTIFVRSVFASRQFNVAEIEKLAWKSSAAGDPRFKVWLHGKRFHFSMAAYAAPDRLRMIRTFRGLIPVEKQMNWPMFCHQTALPLRERLLALGNDILSKPLADDEILITRRRYDRAAAVLLPVAATIALVAWLVWSWPALFLMIPCIIVGWLILRFTVRREGERLKIIRRPRQRVALFSLLVLFAGQIVVGVLVIADKMRELYDNIFVLFCFAALAIILYVACQTERQRKRETAIAAETAPQRWALGEPASRLDRA